MSKLRSVTDLEPGDHLCCIYTDEEEHRALFAPYLRQGLERNEKVSYIVDAHTADEILAYLVDEGVEVDPYLETGQLAVLIIDDAYMKGGRFDPDGMIRLLRGETGQALSEGYSALRVTGEMSWALKGLPGSEKLIEYEAKLNDFLPGSNCLAICQYDRRRFSPEVLLDVLTTHPIAVVGTKVYDNFYYIPPQEYLGNKLPGSTLDHWLQNLEERKRSEDALRESEERFRALSEASFEGVCIHERGKLLAANQAFGAMLGCESLELVGTDVLRFVKNEYLDGVISHIQSGYEETYDSEVVKKDGSTFIAAVRARNIHYHDRPARVAAVKDITERKRAEEALEMINRALEAYAQVVSHDLRGPISVIQAAGLTLDKLAEGCRDHEAADQIKKIAEIIKKSSRNAEALIESLLGLAKAGQVPTRITEVDVKRTVETILEEKSAIIKEKGVKVVMEEDLGLVMAELTHIYQLFSNLVGNALQYNDSPEPELRISYRKEEDGRHRYRVRDSGPGIPVENLERIFDPLFKGKGGGSGIGLSIARKILDVYGGDIKAYNDGGACFEFTLRDA